MKETTAIVLLAAIAWTATVALVVVSLHFDSVWAGIGAGFALVSAAYGYSFEKKEGPER